ncbi:hypothetical protein OZX65_00515 [Leuconostocaceae bacterium ESL0723]|nr:hypothetical protein OZX65_00515 [Leuconostocaceae bacterium ESL0723]
MFKKRTIWLLLIVIAILAVVLAIFAGKNKSTSHSVSTKQINALYVGETKSDVTAKLGQPYETSANKKKIVHNLQQYQEVIANSPTALQKKLQQTVNKNSQSLTDFTNQLASNSTSNVEVLTYHVKDHDDGAVMLIMENDKLQYVISADA